MDLFSPAILSRNWSGASWGGLWRLRQRIHPRDNFHHNLVRIFQVEKHFDEHPQYFPFLRGRRLRPQPDEHGWQPCLTDSQGVHVAAQAARDFFANNPNAESFSRGINDRPGGRCRCPDCLALDDPERTPLGYEGSKSTLYFTWLNRVAQEVHRDYPWRFLGCLAYKECRLPPRDLRLHEAIIPYLTSNRGAYVGLEFKRRDQALLEWWSRAARRIGIYEYAFGVGFAIPRIYSHVLQDAVQHALANNVRGFYAEVYPNWGLDGPKLWVLSRILWDPEVDVDAITAEWNERMFREAAEPMKRYFALYEEAWESQDTVPGEEGTRLRNAPASSRSSRRRSSRSALSFWIRRLSRARVNWRRRSVTTTLRSIIPGTEVGECWHI